jgi:hypothetical protein
MRLFALIYVLTCALPVVVQPQEKINRESPVLADFHQRVRDYVKLRTIARSEVHGLKPTNSAEQIEHYEHQLAERIREARVGLGPGSIFTPEIAAEFRRLIGITMQGSEAQRIRESLNSSKPVRLLALRVNGKYPDSAPLQSTPPSLLLNLPSLPAEVDYRVVGHNLVLRDTEANLIVDYIPNAIP